MAALELLKLAAECRELAARTRRLAEGMFVSPQEKKSLLGVADAFDRQATEFEERAKSN
jgi:hypothetical protein